MRTSKQSKAAKFLNRTDVSVATATAVLLAIVLAGFACVVVQYSIIAAAVANVLQWMRVV
jgi:hypothetical protein